MVNTFPQNLALIRLMFFWEKAFYGRTPAPRHDTELQIGDTAHLKWRGTELFKIKKYRRGAFLVTRALTRNYKCFFIFALPISALRPSRSRCSGAAWVTSHRTTMHVSFHQWIHNLRTKHAELSQLTGATPLDGFITRGFIHDWHSLIIVRLLHLNLLLDVLVLQLTGYVYAWVTLGINLLSCCHSSMFEIYCVQLNQASIRQQRKFLTGPAWRIIMSELQTCGCDIVCASPVRRIVLITDFFISLSSSVS